MKTTSSFKHFHLITISALFLFCSCKNNRQVEKQISIYENDEGISVISNPEFGSLQDAEVPPISFELSDEIFMPELEEGFISGINYLSVDDDGNYFFMDRRQHKMYSLSPEGNLLWSIGQEGKGPGDFENIADMEIHEDNIFVSNIQGRRLDVFDLTGEFLSSYQLPSEGFYHSLDGFTSNEEIIISSGVMGALAKLVSVVFLEGDSIKVINQFQINQGTDIDVGAGMSASSSISVFEEKIYSGNTSEYKIKMFNPMGDLTHIIERDFDHIVRPGFYSSGATRSIRMYGGLESPIFFTDGSFLIKAIWPTNVDDPDDYLRRSRQEGANIPEIINAYTYDYYSSSGELIFSLTGEGRNPEIGHILFIDEANFAYTINSEEPMSIRKYQIHHIKDN